MTTIYCRISSAGQEQGTSIDSQQEACQRLARTNGIASVNIVHETHSAYNSVPPLLEVLLRKKNHRYIFYAVDRFSRNVKLGIENATLLVKNKCTLIFAREKLTVTSTEGPQWNKLVGHLRQSEAESQAISMRVKGAITYLKGKGYHASSHVPFGFEARPDPIKPQRKRLHEEPSEQAILDFIRMCRTEEAKVSEINRLLRIISPAFSRDPIIVEHPDHITKDGYYKPLKTLVSIFTYKDIAHFLNEYGANHRGKEWTALNVSSVLRRADKDQPNVESITESFSFASMDDAESEEEPPKKKVQKKMPPKIPPKKKVPPRRKAQQMEDSDEEEVKVDKSGNKVYPGVTMKDVEESSDEPELDTEDEDEIVRQIPQKRAKPKRK